MIAACSPSWIAEQVADGAANVEDIVSSCEDPSVRATYRFLPPVTDEETGLVYRNEFCARCDGLQPSELTGWRIQLTCTNSTELTSQTSLLFSQLIKLCEVEHFLPPKSTLPPRPCNSLPRGLVYTCPEYVPVDSTKNCTLGGLNLMQSGQCVYANEFCAACWNVSTNLIDCVNNQPFPPDIPENTKNVTIVFDIYGTERTATSSAKAYKVVEETCPSGSVYDVFIASCRILSLANCTNSTAVTLEGGSYSLLSSDSVFWKSYNLSVSIESVDTNGRPLVCIPSVESTACVPLILENSEYYTNKDNSSYNTLLWKSNNASYIIQGYDIQGKPLICTDSTQMREQMPREPSFISYDNILAYIGFSIDLVSCLLFLLTFILFKELRTFFSKLMVNFVLGILLGDISYLIGGPLFKFPTWLCIIFSILKHYLFLCRFSWMTMIGSELVRSIYNVRKMYENTTNKWKLLSVYMLVAWLSPLVVVIPTVIVNFTVDNSVDYGNGICWINGIHGLIAAFLVPVLFSIVYNTIAFVVVMVLVVQMRRGSKSLRTKSEDSRGHRRLSLWKHLRFAFALFTLTGLSWLFVVIALASPEQLWALYLATIFNTTQAVTVSITFICTWKVLLLYRSLLCCCCRGRRKKSSMCTTRKEQIGNLHAAAEI